MEKPFDEWNDDKKRVHAAKEYLPLYHAREVRWCRLGVNVGFEQDGTGKDFSRPVLILKGFSRRVCLAVPLTSSKSTGPYRVPVGVVDGYDSSIPAGWISTLRRLIARLSSV